MRKTIIICDRCKKEIEKIYQINVENVDADGFVQINAADKFGINGKDLCEKCVEEIAYFVKVAPEQPQKTEKADKDTFSRTQEAKKEVKTIIEETHSKNKDEKPEKADKDTEREDFKKIIEEVSGVKVTGRKRIDKEKAVKMRKEGKTSKEIAEMLGVEKGSIDNMFYRLKRNGSIGMY